MSTSVTEHVYELEPHIKVARARAGVLLLIISDALSVLAILAAGGYLSALNTEGLFMAKGDHPPAFVPGLVVAILIVVSGICYYLWERRERQGADSGPRAVFILSCALMIVALAVQCLRKPDYADYVVQCVSLPAGCDYRPAAAGPRAAGQAGGA
jgi:heme/copper-type cytochrome/quinol oxidase subunit 3